MKFKKINEELYQAEFGNEWKGQMLPVRTQIGKFVIKEWSLSLWYGGHCINGMEMNIGPETPSSMIEALGNCIKMMKGHIELANQTLAELEEYIDGELPF